MLTKLIKDCSLNISARLNYNFELYSTLSRATPIEKIDFWKSLSPIFLQQPYKKIIANFSQNVKSELERYITIKKLFMDPIEGYDDIKLLDMFVQLQCTAESLKTNEEIVFDSFAKSLKQTKQKNRITRKILQQISDVLEESCYIRNIAYAVQNHLESKSNLYEQFLSSLQFVPNSELGTSYCIYAPQRYQNKIAGLISKTQKYIIKSEEGLPTSQRPLFKQRFMEIYKTVKQAILNCPAYDNEQSTLQNTGTRLKHFAIFYNAELNLKKIYADIQQELTVTAQARRRAEKNSRALKPVFANQNKTKILPKPNIAPNQLETECSEKSSTSHSDEDLESRASSRIESKESPHSQLESEELDSLSTEEEDISVSKLSRSLDSLTLSNPSVQEVKEASIPRTRSQDSFYPHWKKHQLKPKLSPIALKLLKHKDILTRLFSGNIHKQFTFSELIKIIEDAGGQVINGKGSRRRIIIDKYATDTLEPELQKVPSSNRKAKTSVHEPHGKYLNEYLPSAIVKHFIHVLKDAGLHPDKLWPKELTKSKKKLNGY